MSWQTLVIYPVLIAAAFGAGYVLRGYDDKLAEAKRQATVVKESMNRGDEREDEINREYKDGVPECDTAGLARTLDGLRRH